METDRCLHAIWMDCLGTESILECSWCGSKYLSLNYWVCLTICQGHVIEKTGKDLECLLLNLNLLFRHMLNCQNNVALLFFLGIFLVLIFFKADGCSSADTPRRKTLWLAIRDPLIFNFSVRKHQCFRETGSYVSHRQNMWKKHLRSE